MGNSGLEPKRAYIHALGMTPDDFVALGEQPGGNEPPDGGGKGE